MTPFLRVSINHFEQVNVSWELLGVIFKNERSYICNYQRHHRRTLSQYLWNIKKHIDVKHFSVENIAGMSYYKKHTLEKSPVEILNQVGTNELSSDYPVAKNPHFIFYNLPNQLT